MAYARKIILIALAAVTPLAISSLVLAWIGAYPPKVWWTIVFFTAVSVFLATWVLHEHLVYPIRTLSSLVAALREEDYSLRASRATRDDALGEVMMELNALADLMESRKLEAVEASALLRAVLTQIDAAIFTFDGSDQLRLVNPAGERLLAIPAERLIGLSSAQLGLADLLTTESQTVERSFAGASGRWDVHHSSFREHGVPHRMLVVSDITRPLRQEEIEAWRRIVRVLGHELNNSLAPIRSITTSLERLVSREMLPPDWRDDVATGLRVIGSRTEALTRFTGAYAQLARVPAPRKAPVRIDELVRRAATLENRVHVACSGPEIVAAVDADQIEQVMINLIRNAAESSRDLAAPVAVEWQRSDQSVTIRVIDSGAGLSGTSNLFVPFFTTKPHGTGVGLFLSRQLAEAHGGSLTLENRPSGTGAVATLTLPL